MFNIEAACGCFIGNNRENNEDNFCFNKKHLPQTNKGLKNPLKCIADANEPVFFAVFDGMGGEAKGEEASFVASEIFSDEFKKNEELAISGREFILKACQKATEKINTILKEKSISSMGTTVATLYLSQNEVVAGNVGDSKIFRIRDNQMLQISEDHTDEKILKAMGIQKKPVLLQYIGIPDTEMAIEPYISKGDLVSGDIYLLCSDGVTDVLNANQIFDIVSTFEKADEIVKQLLAQVDIADGADNATVIVVKIL